MASDGISGTMAPGLAFGRRQGRGGKLRTADAMEKVGTDWEFGGMRTWTRRNHNHVSDSEWLAETGGEIPYHTHARRPGSGATAGWRYVEFENGLDGARPGSGETEDGWQVGVVGSGLESWVVRVPQDQKLGGGGGANGMSRAKPTRDGAIWKCSNRSAGVGCPTRCFGRLFGWYWAGRLSRPAGRSVCRHGAWMRWTSCRPGVVLDRRAKNWRCFSAQVLGRDQMVPVIHVDGCPESRDPRGETPSRAGLFVFSCLSRVLGEC